MRLILASSSPYRAALLQRLRLPFEQINPDINELPLPKEAPEQLVRRLSSDKASAVAARLEPQTLTTPTLIIASDQVACLDDAILGKPGTVENAVQQLGRLAGRTALFHTGLCLLDAGSGRRQVAVDTVRVTFRPMNMAMIRRYVEMERPLDCAGSFKSEGLGIILIEQMQGRDPNTLIGLPLMLLVDLLDAFGVTLPQEEPGNAS